MRGTNLNRSRPPSRGQGLVAIVGGTAFLLLGAVKLLPILLPQGYWWFAVLWMAVPMFVIYGGIQTLLGKTKAPEVRESNGTRTVIHRPAVWQSVASVFFGGAFLVIGVAQIISSCAAGGAWLGWVLWMILPAFFVYHGIKNLLHRP